MVRYVGCDQNRIIWVSGQEAEGTIRLPDQFGYCSDRQLLKNFRYQDGRFTDRTNLKDPKDLRIAVVGVWKIPCGISTYTEYLMREIGNLCPEYRIFCETGPEVQPEPSVEPCWRRGEPLTDLVDRIKRYDPDVVLVQHEYGIFPDARHWLAFLSALYDYRVFVALHSVYRHPDKTICEAAVPRIIVHTELAREVLREKGMTKPIDLIPHGCLLNEQKPRLWNIYKSPHTFMQFGFGFEYKGWENSLDACALLKEKYPDVFFTGLFSESPFSQNLHDKYFAKLQRRIESLGIGPNCSLIRGFQTEAVLDSFFRLNRCAVFPYRDNGEHQVYAVTGAARMAMRHGIPTVTSSVPFFSDLSGVCPQANTPEELAQAIQAAWADPQEIVQRQDQFLIQNSWAEAARRYVELLGA